MSATSANTGIKYLIGKRRVVWHFSDGNGSKYAHVVPISSLDEEIQKKFEDWDFVQTGYHTVEKLILLALTRETDNDKVLIGMYDSSYLGAHPTDLGLIFQHVIPLDTDHTPTGEYHRVIDLLLRNGCAASYEESHNSSLAHCP